MSTKFKMPTVNLGKGASELENFRKEVERLGAVNKAMRAREVEREAVVLHRGASAPVRPPSYFYRGY